MFCLPYFFFSVQLFLSKYLLSNVFQNSVQLDWGWSHKALLAKVWVVRLRSDLSQISRLKGIMSKWCNNRAWFSKFSKWQSDKEPHDLRTLVTNMPPEPPNNLVSLLCTKGWWTVQKVAGSFFPFHCCLTWAGPVQQNSSATPQSNKQYIDIADICITHCNISLCWKSTAMQTLQRQNPSSWRWNTWRTIFLIILLSL